MGGKHSKLIYQRRRLEVIEYLGGKCIKCGANNPRYLCFHHRGMPDKDKEIDHNWYMKANWKELIIKEDVELTCSSCHRLTHGTGKRGVPRGPRPGLLEYNAWKSEYAWF